MNVFMRLHTVFMAVVVYVLYMFNIYVVVGRSVCTVHYALPVSGPCLIGLVVQTLVKNTHFFQLSFLP